jgi:hypothetical protein
MLHSTAAAGDVGMFFSHFSIIGTPCKVREKSFSQMLISAALVSHMLFVAGKQLCRTGKAHCRVLLEPPRPAQLPAPGAAVGVP